MLIFATRINKINCSKTQCVHQLKLSTETFHQQSLPSLLPNFQNDPSKNSAHPAFPASHRSKLASTRESRRNVSAARPPKNAGFLRVALATRVFLLANCSVLRRQRPRRQQVMLFGACLSSFWTFRAVFWQSGAFLGTCHFELWGLVVFARVQLSFVVCNLLCCFKTKMNVFNAGIYFQVLVWCSVERRGVQGWRFGRRVSF